MSSFSHIIRRIFDSSQYDNKKILLILFSTVAVLLVDMEFSNISDIVSKQLASFSGVTLFFVLSAFYLVGQYLLFRFARIHSLQFRNKAHLLAILDASAVFVQYFLIAVFIMISLQIILYSSYEVLALLIVFIVCNGLSIVVMLPLAYILFSYYSWERDLVTLSYGISAGLLVVSAAATVGFMGLVIVEKPPIVSPDSEVSFPAFQAGSTKDILNYVYYVLSILSFISVWFSSLLLLRHYSKEIGKTRFWVLVILPLVFHLAQILVLYVIPYIIPNIDYSSFIFNYRLIFTLSSTVGGILFGMPFIIIGRRIPNTSPSIKNYLLILAFGMILYFASGSTTVYHTPYPPFGLLTVSMSGISSYFLLLGVYSSAVSISQDLRLRTMLHQSAIDSSRFLGTIGSAQMEKEIGDRVYQVRQKIELESGIESSLQFEDMKNYLNEVLDELKKEKK